MVIDSPESSLVMSEESVYSHSIGRFKFWVWLVKGVVTSIQVSEETRKRLKDEIDQMIRGGESCGELRVSDSFEDRVKYLLQFRKYAYLEEKRKLREKMEENMRLQDEVGQLTVLNSRLEQDKRAAFEQIREKQEKIGRLEKEQRGEF